jgi:hypothetical protein
MAKKFYGVDVRGKNWLQRVNGVGAWAAGDEGRILYDEADEQVKFGNSSDWSFAGSYNDVPLNTILLVDSATQLAGYTLLTNIDDKVVYISKGPGGVNGVGGDNFGTWSQPTHTHTQPTHTHTLGSHTHTIGSHVHPTSAMTLVISQMPSHTHGCSPDNSSGGSGDQEAGAGFQALTTATGGSGSHTHGNTLSASGNTGSPTGGSDAGGGDVTGGGAPVNTWRPTGRNFTRQQRI